MYLFKSLLTECKNLPQNKKDLLNFLFSNCDDKNTTYLKEFLFKEENKLNNNEFENLLLKNLYISNNSNKKYKDSVLKNVEEYFSMLPNFENRENQIEMAKTIYNNFFENKKTVIEAPT
jgi:hypothetical protein